MRNRLIVSRSHEFWLDSTYHTRYIVNCPVKRDTISIPDLRRLLPIPTGFTVVFPSTNLNWNNRVRGTYLRSAKSREERWIVAKMVKQTGRRGSKRGIIYPGWLSNLIDQARLGRSYDSAKVTFAVIFAVLPCYPFLRPNLFRSHRTPSSRGVPLHPSSFRITGRGVARPREPFIFSRVPRPNACGFDW